MDRERVAPTHFSVFVRHFRTDKGFSFDRVVYRFGEIFTEDLAVGRPNAVGHKDNPADRGRAYKE